MPDRSDVLTPAPETPASSPGSPAARRIIAAVELGLVGSWLLFVLRYQYGVHWLMPHDIGLDALSLILLIAVVVVRTAASRGSGPAVRTAAAIVVPLVVTALMCVTAEYALRFAYRHERTSGHAGDYVSMHGGGPRIVLNSLGYREREIAPRTAGRYRIAVIGDSFTYGQGVETEERFPDVIGRELGPGYEVLNFGHSGNNLPEHVQVLDTALRVASPDYVLLQLNVNDFELPGMERPTPYPLLPEPFDQSMRAQSLFYDKVSDAWTTVQAAFGIVESYNDYMLRHLRDRNSPESVEAFGLLRQFFVRAKAAGVGCGVVLFPATDSMGPHGSRYPFGFLHDRIRMACREGDVRFVDLRGEYSKAADPRTLWVSRVDAHPNAPAHRRAADAIVVGLAADWRH